MSGTCTLIGGWNGGGAFSSAATIDLGDIAPVSFGGRCMIVLVLSVAGNASAAGAPVISAVGVGADTTLKPSGSISAFTQQFQTSFSGGLGGTIGVWTAIASQSFSGLDVKFSTDRACEQVNAAIYAVQGQIEPTTFTFNSAVLNSGSSADPAVTAASLSGNCIQIGVAQGSGNTAAPSAVSGFTTDSNIASSGTGGASAIGHKINSAGASPNTYSLTTAYTSYAAGIISFNTGAAEGVIATNLTKTSLNVHALLNAEIGQITTHLTKASMALLGRNDFEEDAVIATHLRGISQSAAGHITDHEIGTITTTLGRISMQAVGVMEPKGSIVTNLPGIAQTIRAFESQNWGGIVTNLSKPSQSGAIFVANIVGRATTHLSPIAQQATAEEREIGAITMHLANKIGIAIQARALEVFTGHIVTNLPAGIAQRLLAQEVEVGQITTHLPGDFAQSLGGEVFLEAKITTHLGSANVLVTTVVHASQIIKGPIVTNLGQLQVHALGGLLGTPGDGPWYSWRYTDS